ncbi:MAG: Wzz/FepE/Etk N-terminal domain-containing protein [Chloroflexota bacterium]|nr:Wzz/FepE/Etk N-terminal domain-containing protein [Chloroflexota bacterium]
MNNTAEYAPPAEDEELLPVAARARAVRRWLWLVILLPLLTVGVAVGISLWQPPVYEASAKVVVTPTENTNPQKNFSNTIAGLQILAHEMEVAGLTPSMVEEVVRTPGGPSTISLSDLENNLTLEQDEDTRFLSLTYRDTDPSRAQEVANVTAEVFARESPEASGVVSYATVKVRAFAREPGAPEEPDPLRNALIALAIGLMLGVGAILLLEQVGGDDRGSPEGSEREG